MSRSSRRRRRIWDTGFTLGTSWSVLVLLAYSVPARPALSGWTMQLLLVTVAGAQTLLIEAARQWFASQADRRWEGRYRTAVARLGDASRAVLADAGLDDACEWRHPFEALIARRLVRAVVRRSSLAGDLESGGWVFLPGTGMRARVRPPRGDSRLVELVLARGLSLARLQRVVLGVVVEGAIVTRVGTFHPPHRRPGLRERHRKPRRS